MFSGLIAFATSNLFRMLWGELTTWFTAKQENNAEIARLTLQAKIDAEAHSRNMESIKLQHDLGVDVIRVQAQTDVGKLETEGWVKGVEATAKVIGIGWVDAWNAVIRPAVATWSVIMITGHYNKLWTLDDYGWSVCGAALGLYLAERSLFKRGK